MKEIIIALVVVVVLFIVWSKRDPNREIPITGIVSPADGKISVLRKEMDGRVRVGVFMNVYDVHVNRAPVSGCVKEMEHISGGFFPAFSKESDRNDQFLKIVKNAMFKVVNEYKGTAFKSKLENINFSGKTGTSQVTKISLSERESEDFRKKEIEWQNRDHALFVGYMPSKNPKYAISVIIEHGGSGASTAAPIAKQVFNYIYNLEI